MSDLKVKVGVGSTKTKKVLWDGDENNPYIDVVALSDEDGNVLSPQYPLPTNGDSVYAKDINIAASDIGDFTGVITDLFNSIGSSISNNSEDNPKPLLIKLLRPVDNGTIRMCSDSGGTFSNIKIILQGPSGNTVGGIDDSGNNTPYNEMEYSFEPVPYCTILLEFHTTNPIQLNFIAIDKVFHVHSVSMGQKPDGSVTYFKSTAGGNQKFSLEEYDTTFLTNPLPVREYPPDLDGSNYLSVYLLAGAAVDMAVNGSVTPVEYSYTVPVGKKLKLNRGFLAMEDGVTAFAPGNFGAISGPLGNGLEISITPNGESKQVLETWQTNRQIRDTMFDFDQQFKADGAYIGRWTFSKDIGSSFVLNAGDKISALNQDDLTDLDYLSLRIKAKIENV